MHELNRLKAVGYWDDRFRKGISRWPFRASRGYRCYPSPMDLVDAAWNPDIRSALRSYLCSGHEFCSWLGYASCRFSCGIPDDRMGCRDLSDGVWVWPEGLAHYVEAHAVILPEAFVEHARQNRFAVPGTVSLPSLRAGEPVFDRAAWSQWAAEMPTRTWGVFAHPLRRARRRPREEP
jgi:hypothetical protein